VGWVARELPKEKNRVLSKEKSMSKLLKKAITGGCCLVAVMFLQSVQAAAEAEESTSPSVEEILTREPTAEDYEQQERCIQTRRIRRTEVLDDKHIALDMGRDEFYIIQFEHRCHGLRRNTAVIYETTISNRLCAMDTVRGTYGSGIGAMPGPRCSVPGFQKVTKEQVVALKETLKVRSQQEREERKAAKQDKDQPAKDEQTTDTQDNAEAGTADAANES
jgi:hypothetical protein